MVHSAQDEGGEDSLHLVPSLYPSCAETIAHAITSAVVERQEERTQTLYPLDINLITTQLSIAANRRVVYGFPSSTSRIGRTTSRCPSLHFARDHSSIFDGSADLVKTFNQDHHSFVTKCCIHFPQLFVLERKKKLK